ncbi:MAG TPA: hypothetical protein VGK67_14045 [Myxococcales bacterium]|jgi:hypothetical protein
MGHCKHACGRCKTILPGDRHPDAKLDGAPCSRELRHDAPGAGAIEGLPEVDPALAANEIRKAELARTAEQELEGRLQEQRKALEAAGLDKQIASVDTARREVLRQAVEGAADKSVAAFEQQRTPTRHLGPVGASEQAIRDYAAAHHDGDDRREAFARALEHASELRSPASEPPPSQLWPDSEIQ